MPQDSQLLFEAITNHPTGIIERLLAESYAGLPVNDQEREKYRLQWQRADRETVENVDTIGRCTFITCLNGQPIGVGSFDPREAPERGIIGQNCILPAYRGRGFGRRQLEEILRRLRALGIKTAVVTTGAQDFFLPARRMYEACGFVQSRRFQSDFHDGLWLIEYQRTL